jgi:TM2 domain-containing membrane protein YozV
MMAILYVPITRAQSISQNFNLATAESVDENSAFVAIDSCKNRLIAILLAPFGGLHQFYLGNITAGLLYLLLSAIGIGFILSIFECLLLIKMSSEKFHQDLSNGHTWWAFSAIMGD